MLPQAPAPPTPPIVPHYSASQLAAALGITKRAVLHHLRATPPSGKVLVAGNEAPAWTLAELPQELQDKLNAEAARLCYWSVEFLLGNPPSPWEPPVPMRSIPQRYLDRASTLQRALLPSLGRIEVLRARSLSVNEFIERGLSDYRAAFGFPISERHLRRLLKRTTKRDAGRRNWTRLELYLDDRLPTRPQVPAVDDWQAGHELSDLVAGFKDRLRPSPAEKAILWVRTFEVYEREQEEGHAERKTRRGLLKVLAKEAPYLAKNPESLRKIFALKYRRWVEGGRLPAAVEDQRPKKSGRHRAPALTVEDRDKLVGYAVLKTGGRISQAWRELSRENELSEDLLARHLSNPASKSYVPHRVREAVRGDVALLDDIHHGPRQAKLNGAHISRDWSKVPAGDWYQADDVTLPVYYYEPDGKGWFTLWRGQCLVMIDLRSTRILGYCLISERNYNSLAIRSLITRTCDEHGLPRKGFYFERGIWQSAKILTGEKSEAALSLPEVEKGLRDLNLEFIHAKLPRAKPVERVIGAVQDMMEGLPGYVGRDERHDCYERAQKRMQEVKRGALHPEGYFPNAEQWLAQLDSIFDRYNQDPQDGEMTGGLSPGQAYQAHQRKDDPQIRFDASCRYLLAHHRRPLRVNRNGITLRFGKKVFTYRNEQTGRLIGQTVLAWFDPASPEVLCVTDMDRANPFAVELSEQPAAVGADPVVLEREFSRIAAHQAHARTYYRVLSSQVKPAFRTNLVDAETAGLGERFSQEQEAVKARKRTESSLDLRASKATRELGVSVPAKSIRDERRVRALEQMAQISARHREHSTEETKS